MGEDWEIKKEDYEAVNHLEGCLITASFLMRIYGRHAEAERLLGNAIFDYDVNEANPVLRR